MYVYQSIYLSTYLSIFMHTLHVIYHKEIPPTIPKDPIDDLLREKDKRNMYI